MLSMKIMIGVKINKS